MMQFAETSDLLTLIASVDNRRVGDEVVIAWQEILNDLPYDDCRAAVVAHRRTSPEYLMPVHIRRLAEDYARERRRAHNEAVEDAQRRALYADTTRRDRSQDVYALIQQLRDSLPPVDAGKVRRPEVLGWDRARARQERAEPNPHFVAPARNSRVVDGRLELFASPVWVCGEPDAEAPGGVCGRPVESEPCEVHHPNAVDEEHQPSDVEESSR
jgi:hypothetical protein